MRRRPWSRFCSQKKRKKRKLCLAKHDYVYLFCAFLCPRENGVLSVSALERMAGTTRLELATSAVTDRFYNNLQDRGDCQGPPKSFKIEQDMACCGLNCGLRNSLQLTQPNHSRIRITSTKG